MAANTGIPYELITQQIFQEVLDQDSVRTVQVKHNVTLRGKTVSHQIDVFWEFELAGIRYATVIQTKDWSVAVDQGELLKFKAVLDDLPGQPRGIVVTRTGYQQGAGEYARTNGILLYELTEVPGPPPDPPIVIDHLSWATFRILGIVDSSRLALEIATFIPEFSNTKFHADRAWFQGIETRFGSKVAKEVRSTSFYGSPHEIPNYDGDGNKTGTLHEVYAKLVKEMTDQGVLQRDATTSFDQPTFLRTSLLEVPLLKVAAISSRINIRETVQRSLDLPNFVEFVLTNLSDGTVRRVQRPHALLKGAAPNKAIETAAKRTRGSSTGR
jgi:hypothetical protein